MSFFEGLKKDQNDDEAEFCSSSSFFDVSYKVERFDLNWLGDWLLFCIQIGNHSLDANDYPINNRAF